MAPEPRPEARAGLTLLTSPTPSAAAPPSWTRRLWRALMAFWRRTDMSNVDARAVDADIDARPIDADDVETAWALLRKKTYA